MELDLAPNGRNDVSDGYRCQYNDPDFVYSHSYGETQCYLGNALHPAIENTYDWHQHGPPMPDGGRGFGGSGSLHWGVHPSAVDAGLDTTSLATLDAARSFNPINLGY